MVRSVASLALLITCIEVSRCPNVGAWWYAINTHGAGGHCGARSVYLVVMKADSYPVVEAHIGIR